MDGKSARLTPAVVIVDSRNVWGSARRAFGHGRRVEVNGVCSAVKLYGFEATEVYVAIATDGAAQRGSNRLQQALNQNQKYAAAVASDLRGRVLHGRLVERSSDVEEKLVDVQCAIQIARSAHEIVERKTTAQAIIVMSEDMDLIPGYEFAQGLGVPVYAASHATVDTRSDSSWFLLPEGALKTALGSVPGREAGHQLRRRIAITCQRQGAQMWFTCQAFDRSRQRMFLNHNSGATAVWENVPPATDCTRNSRHELFVVGLDIDETGRAFPRYSVSHTDRPFSAAVVQAKVVRWRTPSRLDFSLSSGEVRALTAPIGSVLPGARILVQEFKRGSQAGWRLIGALESRDPSPGWPDPTVPMLCRVVSSGRTPGARVRALLVTDPAQEITLQPPGNDLSRTGDMYAAVPIEHVVSPSGATHVLGVAVSSVLPRP